MWTWLLPLLLGGNLFCSWYFTRAIALSLHHEAYIEWGDAWSIHMLSERFSMWSAFHAVSGRCETHIRVMNSLVFCFLTGIWIASICWVGDSLRRCEWRFCLVRSTDKFDAVGWKRLLYILCPLFAISNAKTEHLHHHRTCRHIASFFKGYRESI